MTTERTCPECRGTGLLWSPYQPEDAPCHRCHGEGVVQVHKQVFGAPSGVPGNEKLTREELNANQQ